MKEITIPSLRSLSPHLVALEEKRAELLAEITPRRAECAVIRARLRTAPSAGNESAPRKVGVDPARQCLNFRSMAKAASIAAVLDGFSRGAGEHWGELRAARSYRRDGRPVKGGVGARASTRGP